MIKKCSSCQTSKPLFDFSKKCDTADGLTSRCKSCLSVARKAEYAARKDEILERNRKWHAENRDSVIKRQTRNRTPELNSMRSRAYYQANKSKVRALNDAWGKANPEKVLDSYRKYARLNPEVKQAASSKRRAAKLSASPDWDAELTDFVTKEAITLARDRARHFGFGWDVDHIIPLQGKTVSGLHVWNNLRVIPASINRSKSNKYEEIAV